MVRPFLLPSAPAFHIYSDASGAFSCGTFHPHASGFTGSGHSIDHHWI